MRQTCSLILLSLVGCTSTNTFECQDDDACVVAGVAGMCETNGFCSFPDDQCDSGRRYGDNAPNEIAGTCVTEGQTSGGTTDESTSTTEPQDPSSSSSSGGPAAESSSSSGGLAESSSSTTSTNPAIDANYVFVSSEQLVPSPSVVEDADALCNSLANTAGLPGTFVAWISADGLRARERLRLDNVTAQGWIRTDGLPFANTIGELVAGQLWYPPALDENGVHLGAVPVMTATNGGGDPTDRCNGWTVFDRTTTYELGWSDSTWRRWTTAGNRLCTEPGHVYCFGVDRVEEVAPAPTEGRLAFISDTELAPDIGVEGFDDACMASAQNAGIDGSFKAAVAVEGAAALDRFDTSGQPWVNAVGSPLTLEDAPLPNIVRLDASVGYRANGEPVDSEVWCGAESVDLLQSNSCQNWTSSLETDNGWLSRSAETVDWFGVRIDDCAELHPVLCLEE